MVPELYDYQPVPRASRAALWLEWVVLFAVVPVIYVTLLESERVAKYPFLGLAFIYAGAIWLRVHPKRTAPARRTWKPFLICFAATVPLAAGLVAMIDPNLFFGFPRHAPRMYAVYMVLYPFLSVWPQEFLYRRFYFWRYAAIFPSERERIWSSALAFCLLHAIYHNWIAVVLSLGGGWFFAREYARTGSLLVVWAEHSLLGQYLFTIGLGRFFYRPL
ncbi:MAG: CPBP family intramembrane glutamic endopeptidase [bacterium]